MKPREMRRLLGVLAGLAPIACRDAVEPAGPRAPAPSVAAAVTPIPPVPVNECDHPPAGTIWCDDFEVYRLGSYFEHGSPSTFQRTATVGYAGSYGMKAVYTPGVPEVGNLKLAFGRNPDPTYIKPVDAGTADYREIYWRAYLRNSPDWTGGGGGGFTRATVLASASWAQAAMGHVFAPDGDALSLDPVRGTDADGNLVTTGYNDFDHFTWLGQARGVTPIFGTGYVGQWYCIEAHMKLNDPGQSNGVLESWINGALDAQRTGLNFAGSYSAFGINAIFFENYWSPGAPQTEERYWDNIVVATQRIGCGSGPAYAPIDLGTLDPSDCQGVGIWSCQANDVNEHGQVVGVIVTASRTPRAFLWENDAMRALQTLGGDWSRAVAINDQGQIAGLSSDSAGGFHAVLWTNGVPGDLGPAYQDGAVRLSEAGQVTWVMRTSSTEFRAVLWDHGQTVDLGTLGGDYALPAAINGSGQTVGASEIVSGSHQDHAFLWANGVMQDLGTLVGCCSHALAMNDQGQVTGGMGLDAGLNGRAFFWDGHLTDLGMLPSDAGSLGRAINQRGQVAGESCTDKWIDNCHAFLWDGGVMQPLWGPDYREHLFDRVMALNDLGQVIGYREDAPPRYHALLWENGTGWDLGTLGGYHSAAVAINNQGDIVGWAELASFATHPVLWRRIGPGPAPQVAAAGGQ